MSFASETSPTFLSKKDWMGLWLFVVILALLHGSLANQASDGRAFAPGAEGYYQLATEAVLAGQLSLKVIPRPELMQLSNPYDSGLNQPYRLIDLSLYQGKYYFYWGLGPVVIFFAPLYLLTGYFPSEAVACAVFGTAALACMGWILLRWRRRYFPSVGPVLTGLALAAIGLGSSLPLLSSGNNVYNVPIAAAALFQAVAWCGIAKALEADRPPILWAFVTGVGAGLMLASRPNYVLWSVVLLLPLFGVVRRQPRRAFALIVAAALPCILSVGTMLILNWVRFGKFSEFGMHYQLTGPAQPEVLFSWRNILPNLRVYGWNAPIFISLFPFVVAPGGAPTGVVNTLPVIFGAFGLLGLRRVAGGWILPLTIALAGLGGLLATAAFFGCGSRYEMDYRSACALAGTIGLLVWVAREKSRRRAIYSWIAGASLAFSAVVAALLQIQSWGSKGDRMLPLSRIFNRPVFWIQSLQKKAYGPITIEFQTPTGRVGSFEPLVSTEKTTPPGEVVFINYYDERRVRIGFFQTGTTHWLSQPLAFDYSQPHRLDLSLGCFMPPDSHPVYDGVNAAERKVAKQDVTIHLDGKLIYKTGLDFGFRHNAHFFVGENTIALGACGRAFTGKILNVAQTHFALSQLKRPTSVASDFGPWRIKVRFVEAPPNHYDPILVSGTPGAADFVYAIYPAPGKIAFGHDSWSFGGITSEIFPLDLSQEHVIEVDHGGLYPKADDVPAAERPALSAKKNHLRIVLDGVTVLDGASHTFDVPPDTITACENRIGGSSTAATFSGTLLSAERY